MAEDDLVVELRGNCPREVVDVLDAVSQAKRISRMELVNRILCEWKDLKVHESNLIHRVTRSNGSVTESDGVRRK